MVQSKAAKIRRYMRREYARRTSCALEFCPQRLVEPVDG